MVVVDNSTSTFGAFHKKISRGECNENGVTPEAVNGRRLSVLLTSVTFQNCCVALDWEVLMVLGSRFFLAQVRA